MVSDWVERTHLMKALRPIGTVRVLMLISLLQFSSCLLWGTDQYYPTEEAAERTLLIWPRLVRLHVGRAKLEWPDKSTKVLRVGDRYRLWEVVALVTQPDPLVVLEQDFRRWGIIAYVGTAGPVAGIEKAVGILDNRLDGQPNARVFSAQYFDHILNAQEDVLGQEIFAHRTEPDYEAMADLLPPLRGYTFLGTTTSTQKIIVWSDGRLGLGVHSQQLGQELFDPATILHKATRTLSATKQGLVGGYLPAIDYALSDVGTGSKWEEIAFSIGRETLETYICLRSADGKRTYWQLPDLRQLESGTAFYRGLLSVHQKWEQFLARGVQLRVPDPRVKDSSKAAMVRALISEVGDHPKYGVGVYSAKEHDTFPPTTILLNGCLLDWGFTEEVRARLGYYLSHFVKPDGTFDYYGPAVSEYGQMLTVASRYVRVTGDTGWMREYLPALRRILDSLEAQTSASRKRYSRDSPYYGILWGSAEADTREDERYYFSGNAWTWRGLDEMGRLLNDVGQASGDAEMERLGRNVLGDADAFRDSILASLGREFQGGPDAFVPPIVGMKRLFGRMTEDEFASYTNYRYWPEMLSPGLLPAEMRNAIIAYRTSHGGEVGGTTRLEDVMDDWPYAHYSWGLLEADQVKHYLLGFYGHIAYHQTPGTFTGYESVAVKGTNVRDYASDYCVPAQLIVPQLLRWMLVWEPWDTQELWLARAVPTDWYKCGFSARHVPTRWGLLSLSVVPDSKGLTTRIELSSPRPEMRVLLRLAPTVAGSRPKVSVQGTSQWSWDARLQAVELRSLSKRVTVRTVIGPSGECAVGSRKSVK